MAEDAHSSEASDTLHRDCSPSSSDTIKLAVFCPQRPLQQGVTAADVAELHTAPEKLEVPSSSTVLSVKQRLEQSFPGGPLARGQSLLWHGRRLTDDEVLSQVVQGTERVSRWPVQIFQSSNADSWPTYQPEMGYVLHLTCPADSWKITTSPFSIPPLKTPSTLAAERLSALSSSLSPSTSPLPTSSQAAASINTSALPETFQPMATSRPYLDGLISPPSLPPHPIAVAIPSATWKTFTTHLLALSPSQRADFIGRLSRAERHYATLSRVLADRQGPHMRPIDEQAIQHLRSTGQIGYGFPSQSVTELEASIEQLLDDLGCMQAVRKAQAQATGEFDSLEKTQADLFGGQTSSRLVYISGYPFLLQIPPQFAVPAKERREAYIQTRKVHTMQGLLHTMLSIARNMHTSQSSALYSVHQLPFPGRARDAYQQGGPLPPVAGLAMQQAPNRPNGMGAIGIGAQAAGRLAGAGMPTARLAVVINLDEILALAMPLLFLSIKLGFLIYVFGKHATTRKRIVMCAMAFAWVVWEGMSIHRRRRAAEARRQQNREAEQRPAQVERVGGRNGNQRELPPNGPVALEPPLQLNGEPALGQGQANIGGQPAQQQYLPPALAQLQERMQGLGDQQELRRRHRNGEQGNDDARRHGRTHGSSSRSSHRQPPSRYTPKYWLYLLAKVGLSAEARDMGLSRSVLRQMQASSRQATQSGTPVPPLPAQANAPGTPGAIRLYQAQPMTPRRALRNLYIGVVLFVGTLIPEVERLRKKALLKREKKLAELELTRRQMHLASLQAELKRLEDQRKALEDQMTGGQTHSASCSQGQQATRSDSSSSDHADKTDAAPANENARQDTHGKRPAGLGIDSMPPSDSDTDLFDPPFAKDEMKEALQDGASGSVSKPIAERNTLSEESAGTSSKSAGMPRIRIDTDAGRADTMLSPLRALQRRDENGNLIAEEDYSAPSTPLLSPSMTEEEDDRQDEAGDDDVGM